MKLYNFIKFIDHKKQFIFNKKLKIKYLTKNSKLVRKNSIYIVDYKKKIKKNYLLEAKKNGAVFILTNKNIRNSPIPYVKSKNIDEDIKKILYKLKPNKPKNIIGITGTNGKSSVLLFLSSILSNLKIETSSIGTLGYYKNLKYICNSNLTTPEYEEIYQYSHSLRPNKNVFVFEVSSHAIALKRLNNILLDIAVLTNITRDHLDFHGNFKNYQKTKFNLFIKHLKSNGYAVLNNKIKDINLLKKIIKQKKIKITTYGNQASDVYCFIKNNITKLKIKSKIYNINFKPYANFELDNLSCAISCCIQLGISESSIIKSINKIKRPQGRMELIKKLKNGSKVFIDFAHTPDALENVLKSQILETNEISLVFGCGGNRDYGKRRKMGLIANKYAKNIYVTDDNPRYENPNKIREEILKYCKRAKNISNRKDAILSSLKNLKSKSILIIAGKGHEKFQIIKNKKIKFDDAEVVKNCIKKLKL
ncbi:MAG: UDP-N-acetylmuramoyl-L-alanyl-D-glutamate--2,6-diaminopimelate ligase [Alphaproteobacteria bacterium MarineAlpha5_Bin9]|nr:MAG: UDP-N-acetylmuramoyl-L-alanyl-D-glutamate--2,6-diaminopimelate ligase [Alphaproteobacteria bacterium MarineAlpha5_Bin9]|tara:strand:- start:12845 stop:14278 length:1434 start_codon:yes stop_codon:yes gene_type:complete